MSDHIYWVYLDMLEFKCKLRMEGNTKVLDFSGDVLILSSADATDRLYMKYGVFNGD